KKLKETITWGEVPEGKTATAIRKIRPTAKIKTPNRLTICLRNENRLMTKIRPKIEVKINPRL
ncbi:hypothetical protein AKJ61_02515, partial [candidate division MSBL1 archaeon SCGC-AAA259B11]